MPLEWLPERLCGRRRRVGVEQEASPLENCRVMLPQIHTNERKLVEARAKQVGEGLLHKQLM